ncbi:hypothetical protein [Ihuprevotella massiliensis]|jgi:hypothetical protein|uniref:hypothetical protein n=1 Tax=Ihuprevotella massiliensis TaxID=1852368 RepID=UPI00094ED51B
MTAEEEKILHLFETHVRQLIIKHKDTLEHNKELNQALTEEKTRVQELEQRIATLEQQYANLKMAKMIEITTAENQAAQKRINKLIREIDKCIALLNV